MPLVPITTYLPFWTAAPTSPRAPPTAPRQGRADPENGFPPEFDRQTWLALREGLGALRVERISPTV